MLRAKEGMDTASGFKDTKSNAMGAAGGVVSDQEREQILLAWTTERCNDDSIEFEDGWMMIKEYGLNVMNAMLRKFLLNRDGKERKER